MKGFFFVYLLLCVVVDLTQLLKVDWSWLKYMRPANQNFIRVRTVKELESRKYDFAVLDFQELNEGLLIKLGKKFSEKIHVLRGILFRKRSFLLEITQIDNFSIRLDFAIILPSSNTQFLIPDQKIGLVERYKGYTAEEYKLTCQDGYQLVLHRITGSPKSPKSFGKPVIYMQHGLFTSSDAYVFAGVNTSLAFDLADAGYDIWLGNIRGNTYSRSHLKFSPVKNRKDFWDFCIHEMAVYDVSKFLDYVLQKTKQKNLIYVSHSMGTTIGYILLSLFPEYNDKISLFIGLSPIVYFKNNNSSVIKFLRKLGTNIEQLIYTYEVLELLPQNRFLIFIGRTLLRNGVLLQLTKWMFTLFSDIRFLDNTVLRKYFEHFPAGVSANTLDHYFQFLKTGEFRAYDYGGELKNLEKYNRTTPPPYNLSNIRTKIALFYAKRDSMANIKDVFRLKDELPNVVHFERIRHESFNHFDFFMSKLTKSQVNDRVIALLNRINPVL